ncbi:MAG: ATP-binding cassette domain-containing protein [Bacteroidales bacterium]|nr:ATP-binding cassette domain-containing protein [Bacteroidales bacterium]
MFKIENLNFSYSKHEVLKDINLNLECGKIYGLLGQNGVGKTTLLKIMSGLLKPKSGACTILGYNPFKREPGFLQELFFIPEDFVGPDIEVNKYAALRGAFYPNYDGFKFSKLLTDFEVDGRSKFTKLSFGQQKKAIIAFALATNTKLVLMDEPSNGLDIPSKSQLRRIISQAATDESCIIISTHQVRDLENLIDPIIILDTNDVLVNASIEEISSKLKFEFRDTPDKEALYSEPTLGGYLTVYRNESGIESKVNIETLFNAVLINKKTIKQILNK